jgi:ribosomal protein S12 methylthiotransferase
VGFISLGCPKNLVDSEVMMGLLDRAGARLTAHPEEAEILIVNTCSFIDTAKQESVDTILEMARHKTSGSAKKTHRRRLPGRALPRRNPQEHPRSGRRSRHRRAGIHSRSRRPRRPQRRASPFNILSGRHAAEDRPGIGTHPARNQGLSGGTHKRRGALAPEATSRPEGDLREQQGRFRRDDWQGATHLLPTYLYDETTPRFLTTPKSSAYIKIAEGCDHPCSFCVIPNLRGKFRSRRFESVVAEAQQLVARGVREITLIGQDTTCYGEDLGLKDGLATLCSTPSPHPQPALAPLPLRLPQPHHRQASRNHRPHDNICKYLDLPLQHASPDVLKRMKRGGRRRDLPQDPGKSPRRIPGIALRTSFIVGFPGESLRDFEILEEFIKEAKFDWLGVFNYSDEEGSGAFSLDAKLPKRTIEARKRRLMKLQQSISKRAKQQWVGRELVVLAEGESEETPLLWEARTQFHAPEIDGKVYINDFGEL